MMFDEQEDKKIKKLLYEWTNVNQSIQKQTWENIEAELFEKNKRQGFTRYKWILATLSFMIIGLFLFSYYTVPGQAFVQEIRELFIPQKQENIEIEGMEETTNLNLHANESLKYVIYIDEEHYKMEEGDGTDLVITKEALGEEYPEVFMEIEQLLNSQKEEIIEEIKEDSLKSNMLILSEEEVLEPVEAIRIGTIEQDEARGDILDGWDSIMKTYYIIEVSEGHLFIVTQVYFQEAAEGHGARFDHMLKSFEVIQ